MANGNIKSVLSSDRELTAEEQAGIVYLGFPFTRFPQGSAPSWAFDEPHVMRSNGDVLLLLRPWITHCGLGTADLADVTYEISRWFLSSLSKRLADRDLSNIRINEVTLPVEVELLDFGEEGSSDTGDDEAT
jgi:hypothetical protein